MDEQKKYKTIKKLVDNGGSKDRATLKLGVTKRHINQMIRGYKEKGKSYFIHGNRGHKLANTIPDTTRKLVVDLYRTKYCDCNFAHFTELLARNENIKISESSVRLILETDYILSPRVTRAKQKRVRKELKAMESKAQTRKEIDKIQTNLIAVEDSHSRRPRVPTLENSSRWMPLHTSGSETRLLLFTLQLMMQQVLLLEHGSIKKRS